MSVIRVSIGGTVYNALKSTWEKSFFFATLLSGKFDAVRDDSGAIFVDRSNRLFEVILDYLRSGSSSAAPSLELIDEASFYGLDHFADSLRERLATASVRTDDRSLVQLNDGIYSMSYRENPDFPFAHIAFNGLETREMCLSFDSVSQKRTSAW